MDARVQRRVQRYGWDLAASRYETLWQAQLAPAHDAVLRQAQLQAGESVLDVACGTGLVSLEAARAVGRAGRVVGIDISGEMVAVAQRRAGEHGVNNAGFLRMEAECIDMPDAAFDVVVCALGLMYMPDPGQALREMRRVLKPGGRLLLAVWGERARCGWSAVFPIVEAEVSSEVCPLFFRLGQGDALAGLCTAAAFDRVTMERIGVSLDYPDAAEACLAALVGGPAALAWSRFTEPVRTRVCERYVTEIERFRSGEGYRLPGEFVVVSATAG